MLRERAGWNDELEQVFMLPLRKNPKDLRVSVGDHAPLYKPGAHVDYRHQIKLEFKQINSPPIDLGREANTKSSLIMLGPRLALADIAHKDLKGILIPSPVLNKWQYQALLRNKTLKIESLDTLMSVSGDVDARLASLSMVVEKALRAVSAGVECLVLTDANSNSELAPQPSIIIAAMVHNALLKAGKRRAVSLIVESSTALVGADYSKLISVGVEAVYSPRPYDYDTALYPDFESYKKCCLQYQDSIHKEIQGNEACAGYHTTSAYIGSKAIDLFTLDQVCELLDVPF